MKTLTQRQFQIFSLVAMFIEDRGFAPSYEEICAGAGLSSLATVHVHLKKIEAKGYLSRDYNRSRSLTLTPEAQRWWNKRKKPAQKVACPACSHEFEVRA